jgi:acyl-homoserine lactone acylase PvdQ
VAILKDRSHVSHIYAKNENDRFFAQSCDAAHDLRSATAIGGRSSLSV